MGGPWPLYGALDEGTAWDEWSAAAQGRVDPREVTRTLWPLHARALRVVDLRRKAVRRTLNADLNELTGEWEDARPLAERARALGAQGMIVPSAARAGGWSLVAFPEGFGAVEAGKPVEKHPQPGSR